jgi:hypothetical protein
MARRSHYGRFCSANYSPGTTSVDYSPCTTRGDAAARYPQPSVGRGWIDDVLASARRTQTRVRDLPSRVVVYLLLAGGLFAELGYRPGRCHTVAGIVRPARTANLACYGWQTGSHGGSGYPLIRLLAVVACGTRTVMGAVSVRSLSARPVPARCARTGMLLLADRNFAVRDLVAPRCAERGGGGGAGAGRPPRG